MSLRAKTFSFLKRVLTNRVGHLLFVLNVCLIVYFFSQMTGRLPHADGTCVSVIELQKFSVIYQLETPLWLVVWIVMNFPALLCAGLVSMSFEKFYPTVCAQTSLIIQFVTLIIFSLIQWQFVGYVIEKLTKIHLGNKRRI